MYIIALLIRLINHHKTYRYVKEIITQPCQKPPGTATGFGLKWIFGELLQGAADKRERSTILSYWRNIPKFDSTAIWIEAGIYSSDEKAYPKGVGMIDCAIIIAARRTNSSVWSLDRKLN